jgi:hypothetical protein
MSIHSGKGAGAAAARGCRRRRRDGMVTRPPILSTFHTVSRRRRFEKNLAGSFDGRTPVPSPLRGVPGRCERAAAVGPYSRAGGLARRPTAGRRGVRQFGEGPARAREGEAPRPTGWRRPGDETPAAGAGEAGQPGGAGTRLFGEARRPPRRDGSVAEAARAGHRQRERLLDERLAPALRRAAGEPARAETLRRARRPRRRRASPCPTRSRSSRGSKSSTWDGTASAPCRRRSPRSAV